MATLHSYEDYLPYLLAKVQPGPNSIKTDQAIGLRASDMEPHTAANSH